jgi:MFS transporter, PHS family, inorganic phosphate transporter
MEQHVSSTISGHDELARLDETRVTRLHWKVMFISGMGFLTDAYDLFIIGVVIAILKEEWHPSAVAVGLVTSTALLASAVGAIVFGRIADILGRKRIYGYEVLVLAIGALASAFSPNIWWLIVFRIILGLGIGGDYPVSSTIMSEYAGKSTRGMMVTLVFSMQAVGLTIGPLLAALLLASGMPHDWTWRLLLAFGAIPPIAVFEMRRHLAETPRYLLAAGNHKEFNRVMREVVGAPQDSATRQMVPARTRSFRDGFRQLLKRRDLAICLLGASLAWAFMDFAYYGNTVSSPLVIDAVTPDRSLLWHTLMEWAIFLVSAAPGYVLAAMTMDRLGRKPIQILGFAMMAASFGTIALVPGIERLVIPFVIIYGISYFFTEFGPNATTFVYPAELFPVELRTTAHGIASAVGKLGAFVGVFLFPIFLAWRGLFAAELAAAIVSLLGLIVTVTMLPETKRRSLEELASGPA